MYRLMAYGTDRNAVFSLLLASTVQMKVLAVMAVEVDSVLTGPPAHLTHTTVPFLAYAFDLLECLRADVVPVLLVRFVPLYGLRFGLYVAANFLRLRTHLQFKTDVVILNHNLNGGVCACKPVVETLRISEIGYRIAVNYLQHTVKEFDTPYDILQLLN